MLKKPGESDGKNQWPKIISGVKFSDGLEVIVDDKKIANSKFCFLIKKLYKIHVLLNLIFYGRTIMSNNFLLSMASVLILAAVVLHSLVVPAWSMDGEDEKDQNNNSAITVKDSNNAGENENNNGNGSINSIQQWDSHVRNMAV